VRQQNCGFQRGDLRGVAVWPIGSRHHHRRQCDPLRACDLRSCRGRHASDHLRCSCAAGFLEAGVRLCARLSASSLALHRALHIIKAELPRRPTGNRSVALIYDRVLTVIAVPRADSQRGYQPLAAGHNNQAEGYIPPEFETIPDVPQPQTPQPPQQGGQTMSLTDLFGGQGGAFRDKGLLGGLFGGGGSGG